MIKYDMKKLFLVLLIFIHNILYGQSELDFLFWPKEMPVAIINEYFEDINYISFENVEKEYYYVLDFLIESIIAHKRNCNNYYEETSLNIHIPEYIDGKLKIVEEKRTINYFNKEKAILYEKADINILTEFSSYSLCISAYNMLIDYWYERTGIYLERKLNEKSLNADLWNKYMWKDEYIKQKIFTPEELEEYKKEFKEKHNIDL
jgi:hypothetical protein